METTSLANIMYQINKLSPEDKEMLTEYLVNSQKVLQSKLVALRTKVAREYLHLMTPEVWAKMKDNENRYTTVQEKVDYWNWIMDEGEQHKATLFHRRVNDLSKHALTPGQ